MESIKDFTEHTLDDALTVVKGRLSNSVGSKIRLLLRNPARRFCEETGDVVYDGNGPIGFQAAIPRIGYYGKHRFLSVAGGMLAMKKGASPAALISLMERTIAPRHGSVMFFGNTAIPISMKLNSLLGVDGIGCESCGKIRFAVFKWGGFVKACLHGRLPAIAERLTDLCGSFLSPVFYRGRRSDVSCVQVGEFAPEVFDAFFEKYLERNDGVVLSRTAEELAWAFGDGLRDGRNLLVIATNPSGLQGYVVVRAINSERTRWMVVDWIALENNKDVLSDLLRHAVRILRTESSAVFLECIGFRMDVQDIIKRHLPFTRKAPNNSTNYRAYDSNLKQGLKQADRKGWFFGPYDGDRFLAGS